MPRARDRDRDPIRAAAHPPSSQLLDVALRRAAGDAVEKLPSIGACCWRRVGGRLAVAMELAKVAMQGAWEAHREEEEERGGRGGEGEVWASRPLSDELQCYAALDVECCRALHDAMRADLAAGGAAVKPAADELLARVRAASERRLGEYRDLEAAYPQTGGADPVAAKAPEI